MSPTLCRPLFLALMLSAAADAGPAPAGVVGPPAVPAITSPVDGAFVSVARPTVLGTGPVNTTVEVWVDAALLGNTVADAGGNWSFQPASNLAEGVHQLEARSVDASSNASAFCPTLTFTVDTVAPAPPVIQSPAEGAVLGGPTLTVFVSSEPDVTVALTLDGASFAGGQADASGSLSFYLSTASIGSGPHTLFAQAVDAANNVSAPSSTLHFELDLTPPAAPTIGSPADGTVVTTATPTLTGTAPSGTTVVLDFDGAPAGMVTADGSGGWSFTPSAALPDHDFTVDAFATDALGNQSAHSASIHLLVNAQGLLGPRIFSIGEGVFTAQTLPLLSGDGDPGRQVTLSLDGAAAIVPGQGADGQWELQVITALAEGPHVLVASYVDTGASNSSHFTVDLTAPAAPVLLHPSAGEHVHLGALTLTGTSEPFAQVAMSVDGTSYPPVIADATGAWSMPIPDPVTDGEHLVHGASWDRAGNRSAESGAVSFTAGATGLHTTLDSGPGASTSETSATFAFHGSTAGTFECATDGAAFAACVSPVTVTGLAVGVHSFSVRLKDPEGNLESPPVTRGWALVAEAAPAGCGCDSGGGDLAACLAGLLGLLWRRGRSVATPPSA